MNINVTRYLMFEVNQNCDLGDAHASRCPNKHPQRSRFTKSSIPLTDVIIINFWNWCRSRGFRGVVGWQFYNEPSLAWDRIQRLMRQMQRIDPMQPFSIISNNNNFQFPGIDIVKRSYYNLNPDPITQLDNRLAAIDGEGLPYENVPFMGSCVRGLCWEMIIDYFGNLVLCCNDWRCEEGSGSICTDTDWNGIYARWLKRSTIEWYDRDSYERLPRMCRSCMEVNPKLAMSYWL
jgi:hypothetical protein